MKRDVRSFVFFAVSCLLAAGTAAAQVPPEVPRLDWCPQSHECLEWPAVDGATGYAVYRGLLESASSLVSGGVDACDEGAFAEPTTGAVLADPPSATGYWYLVTAVGAFGEGSPGVTSDGPRTLASAGACAAGGGLVLNEVDYDQPGSDAAEFVEIYNGGSADRSLAGVALVLVNGTTSAEYGRVDLGAVAASLPAGGYLVVGSDAVLAALPAGVSGAALPSSLQNGSPDGLALIDTIAGTLLDALSYEGEIRMATLDGLAGTFDLVEGQPASAEDSSTVDGALARLPDGHDGGDADTDWSFVAVPTPGAANAAR